MKVKLTKLPKYSAQVEQRLEDLERAAHLAQSAMKSCRVIRLGESAEFVALVLRMAGMKVVERPMTSITELIISYD